MLIVPSRSISVSSTWPVRSGTERGKRKMTRYRASIQQYPAEAEQDRRTDDTIFLLEILLKKITTKRFN